MATTHFSAPKQAFDMTGVGGQTVLTISVPSAHDRPARDTHKGVIPGNLALTGRRSAFSMGAIPPA